MELEEPIQHILRQIVSIRRSVSEREVVFLRFKSEYENLYAKKLKLEKMQSNKDIHADKVSICVMARLNLHYSNAFLKNNCFAECTR